MLRSLSIAFLVLAVCGLISEDRAVAQSGSRGSGTTVPRSGGTVVPRGSGTTVPRSSTFGQQGSGTTAPRGSGTTTRPGSGTTARPGSGTTGQSGSGTTARPGSGTAGSGTPGGAVIRRSTPSGGSGQAGSGSGQSGSGARSAASSFEQKFWKYLQSAHYRQWAPVPGRSGDAYPGQSPHGAMLKMYLNRTAAGRPQDFPNSSIIVKENYAADGTTLAAITVMYKTKNYNPQAGDWYWIKYLPNGAVDTAATPTGNVKLAGKPNGCIECHASAGGGDYAFFNDNL